MDKTRKSFQLIKILIVLIITFLGISFSPNVAYAQLLSRHYGYYFVEDPALNLSYIGEIKDFSNIINIRYDNGRDNNWDHAAANRIRNSRVKVVLQVPFGTESNWTLFVDVASRVRYLNKVRQDMIDTNFMSHIAYIAIFEEWYTLINHGYYDAWPIFKGKTKEEKFAIAKMYLEEIIDDVHRTFPGIPTVIVENILPYPEPPSNIDVLGIDAYYIPTSSLCTPDQRMKFNREVIPYYDAARLYSKPIMMVAPSFVVGPWKMLSECQMRWYANLVVNGNYRIEALLWFLYSDVGGLAGVRNYQNLVNYQKVIGCYLLGRFYCRDRF